MFYCVVVFFIIGFFIFNAGVHWIIWKKCIDQTELNGRVRKFCNGLLVCLYVFLITSLFLSRAFRFGGGPGFGWMALSWFAASMLIAAECVQRLIGFVKTFGNKNEEFDASRRVFMHRMVGGSVAIGSTATMAGGINNALATPKIKNVQIQLKKLPKRKEPFVLIQLSDVHVGNTIGREYIQRIADSVNEQDADLVVITGDLVDGSVSELRDAVEPLSRLRSKYGTYFSTGNHEYYSGADAWVDHLNSIGIKVLRNEHVWVGDKNQGFYLAGIDDAKAGRWPGHGPDLEKALLGCDRSHAVVLMAHQPKQVFDAKHHNVDLQLSGHTHGGQIWPWHYLAKASQKGLLAGHSTHDNTQLYISRGTGYWGPPVRTFAPSEITKIHLSG